MPKSRRDFWEPKLRGNRERDEGTLKQYEEMGWQVLIVWECLTKNEEELKENIRAFMEDC
jgi:DNA mismatch endonuclease (patch repair protein)